MISLAALDENQSATVKRLSFEKPFATRLQDMGFCRDERVICLKKSVFSSPILYGVKGAQIALRRADAAHIGVVL